MSAVWSPLDETVSEGTAREARLGSCTLLRAAPEAAPLAEGGVTRVM